MRHRFLSLWRKIIKETIGYGLYLDEQRQTPPLGHDLQKLWTQAKVGLDHRIGHLA